MKAGGCSRRGGGFACLACGESGFRTDKALQQHARKKHGQKCLMKFCVSGSQCPICDKVFADRLRVIAHLSESRTRTKIPKVTCGDRIRAGEGQRLPDTLVAELDEEAKAQRAEARKAGHTRPVVPQHLHAQKRPLDELRSMPRRRVCRKTAPAEVSWIFVRPQSG